MNLPKEWERTRNQLLDGMDNPAYRVGVENAVERCYALHCKPPRELTDAEIDQVCIKVNSYFVDPANYRKAYKELLEAHQRKQQEPETVKFRAARWLVDGSVDMVRCEPPAVLGVDMEWLPGEPQTIEVKLP